MDKIKPPFQWGAFICSYVFMEKVGSELLLFHSGHFTFTDLST